MQEINANASERCKIAKSEFGKYEYLCSKLDNLSALTV
jgi:hypothetical protein